MLAFDSADGILNSAELDVQLWFDDYLQVFIRDGMITYVAFQSRPTDVLTQFDVSGFFFLSLVCINWSWSKKSISLFMEIKVVVKDF